MTKVFREEDFGERDFEDEDRASQFIINVYHKINTYSNRDVIENTYRKLMAYKEKNDYADEFIFDSDDDVMDETEDVPNKPEPEPAPAPVVAVVSESVSRKPLTRLEQEDADFMRTAPKELTEEETNKLIETDETKDYDEKFEEKLSEMFIIGKKMELRCKYILGGYKDSLYVRARDTFQVFKSKTTKKRYVSYEKRTEETEKMIDSDNEKVRALLEGDQLQIFETLLEEWNFRKKLRARAVNAADELIWLRESLYKYSFEDAGYVTKVLMVYKKREKTKRADVLCKGIFKGGMLVRSQESRGYGFVNGKRRAFTDREKEDSRETREIFKTIQSVVKTNTLEPEALNIWNDITKKISDDYYSIEKIYERKHENVTKELAPDLTSGKESADFLRTQMDIADQVMEREKEEHKHIMVWLNIALDALEKSMQIKEVPNLQNFEERVDKEITKEEQAFDHDILRERLEDDIEDDYDSDEDDGSRGFIVQEGQLEDEDDDAYEQRQSIEQRNFSKTFKGLLSKLRAPAQITRSKEERERLDKEESDFKSDDPFETPELDWIVSVCDTQQLGLGPVYSVFGSFPLLNQNWYLSKQFKEDSFSHANTLFLILRRKALSPQLYIDSYVLDLVQNNCWMFEGDVGRGPQTVWYSVLLMFFNTCCISKRWRIEFEEHPFGRILDKFEYNDMHRDLFDKIPVFLSKDMMTEAVRNLIVLVAIMQPQWLDTKRHDNENSFKYVVPFGNLAIYAVANMIAWIKSDQVIDIFIEECSYFGIIDKADKDTVKHFMTGLSDMTRAQVRQGRNQELDDWIEGYDKAK